MMTSQANRGIIDAGNRVLGQVLAKTSFKDNLRTLLMNIDPENAPALIRTFLGKDVEVPLAIVSALPSVVNAFIAMADEFARQLNEKFPEPLLQGFAASLVNEIDLKTLASAQEGITRLVHILMPVFLEVKTQLEEKQGCKKEDGEDSDVSSPLTPTLFPTKGDIAPKGRGRKKDLSSSEKERGMKKGLSSSRKETGHE